MVIHITKRRLVPVSLRRSTTIATLVAALAAVGCARATATAPAPAAAPVTGVAPLQPFGSEPALMPALSFEPLGGRLEISAPQPVYVTVVEVDQATQARTVVFPEVGRAPLRVAGTLSLDLALSRDGVTGVMAERAGQEARDNNRGHCATHDAQPPRERPPCGEEDDLTGAPVRTVLVIASTDALVVADRPGGSGWRIPEELPGDWAAVYVWTGARSRAP